MTVGTLSTSARCGETIITAAADACQLVKSAPAPPLAPFANKKKKKKKKKNIRRATAKRANAAAGFDSANLFHRLCLSRQMHAQPLESSAHLTPLIESACNKKRAPSFRFSSCFSPLLIYLLRVHHLHIFALQCIYLVRACKQTPVACPNTLFYISKPLLTACYHFILHSIFQIQIHFN